MAIIAVEMPAQATNNGRTLRYDEADAAQALEALLNGQAATDGEARNPKSTQQAAWDLRKAVQTLVGMTDKQAKLMTSKSLQAADGQTTYKVFVRAQDAQQFADMVAELQG